MKKGREKGTKAVFENEAVRASIRINEAQDSFLPKLEFAADVFYI
jgi:hypothetical protein